MTETPSQDRGSAAACAERKRRGIRRRCSRLVYGFLAGFRKLAVKKCDGGLELTFRKLYQQKDPQKAYRLAGPRCMISSS